jgi:hypothetical protein
MVTIFLLLLADAHAMKGGAYPEQVFRADGITRVEISGVRGRVRMRGESSSTFRLRVRHSVERKDEGWGLSVERRGSTLVLEVYNVAYGPEWRKILGRDRWPAFDIDLSGPARPAVIGWREGAIDVARWRADVDASIVRGNVRLEGGAGRVNLQAGRGDVLVTDFNGDLTVRGEGGRLELARLNGTQHLHWFAGQAALAGVRGDLSLDAHHARVSGRGLSGRIDLGVVAGEVDVTDVRGHLVGTGQTASWRIAPRARADVTVRSRAGSVSVFRAGAVDLFLSSRSGAIDGSSAKAVVRGNRRVATGRVGRGRVGEFGRVFVRTDSGAVRLID